MSYSEKEVQEISRKKNVELQEETIFSQEKKIFLKYSKAGDEFLILFVHGSPGSWDAYFDYLVDKDILENSTLISFDRLGFGKSNPTQASVSLEEHSKSVQTTLNHFPKAKKIILVGHSYGGPIVLKHISMNQNIACSVLLAGTYDPDLENPEWYNKVGDWKIVQFVLPKGLLHSNLEMMPLKQELEILSKDLKQVRSRTLFLHGKKDSIVNYQHSVWANQQLNPQRTKLTLLQDQNHFLPWNEFQKVKELILDCKSQTAR